MIKYVIIEGAFVFLNETCCADGTVTWDHQRYDSTATMSASNLLWFDVGDNWSDYTETTAIVVEPEPEEKPRIPPYPFPPYPCPPHYCTKCHIAAKPPRRHTMRRTCTAIKNWRPKC